MNPYGPSRSELWFRLAVSLGGLVLVAVAVVVKGFSNPGWVEAVGVGGVFFGLSALWSAWKLFGKS